MRTVSRIFYTIAWVFRLIALLGAIADVILALVIAFGGGAGLLSEMGSVISPDIIATLTGMGFLLVVLAFICLIITAIPVVLAKSAINSLKSGQKNVPIHVVNLIFAILNMDPLYFFGSIFGLIAK